MKKLKYLVFLAICLIPIFKIEAASATISVTADKTRVIVGETVNVTVKVSSSTAFTAWQFDIYHSNNLSLVSSSAGGLHIASYDADGIKSKSYTLKFKAKSSGEAKVYTDDAIIGSAYENSSFSVTNGSKKFNLMTQAELEATYSKNNYLKSLSIEGHTLTPNFDKNTLEYNIELENGTESIEVKATKEDSTASINGTGTIELVEGPNLIEIVVTAQNGSTRKYKINATVKELDPINVTIGSDSYTVIRKKELMPEASSYFIESTVKINEEDVPSYYNETANITLVGLKNVVGETNLYIYENEKFTLYEELVFNKISIKTIEAKDELIPEGYTKTKLEINGKSVLGYNKENSDYYLIYGLNLETGKENLYKYDKTENTLQRYEEIPEEDNSIYNYIIIGMFGFIVLSYIIFIILIAKNNKKAKQIENTMRIDISKIQEVKTQQEVKEEKSTKEKKKKAKK